MKLVKKMTLDELYHEKGKITTQLQILQNQLQAVDIRISEILRNLKEENGSTDSNRDKK